MSIVTLNKEKLHHNFFFLDSLFKKHYIEWSIVTKVLCGNEVFLKEVLSLPIEEFCDSRISNLQAIKRISPEVQTVYIKPVPVTFADDILQYADVSFNTEVETLVYLSKRAVELGKIHKTLIMVEMGELREGVVRGRLVSFFEKIKDLPNIEIVGIGTNLTCLNGVLPDYEKMKELHESKLEIEQKFGIRIPYVSGGASVTIPLILRNELPSYINHFRVGESLYFGTDVFDSTEIEAMHQDVFMLHAEIIEIKNKPNVPEGTLGLNLTGEQKDFSDQDFSESTKRALLDIGLLEMNPSDLTPIDSDLNIIGGSSDMLVMDLENSDRPYKVGDFMTFKINYMGLLSLMNSDYVAKMLEEDYKNLEPLHEA
ncbi:alanine racemase [Chryseobacterium sp. A321]